MARVKQVATKTRKFMGCYESCCSSKKEREEGTEVENSNEETETVAERARKRKGKGIAGSEPSEKKKKMEKAPASKPFVQQNIFEPRYIKWDSFSDLPYEFEDLFTFQGWMEFSELNEYYYPYLIQEFYGSMKEVVKGESFSIGTFKDSRKLEGYDEKAFQLSIFLEGHCWPSNAKATGPSGVKISEVEEEEEEEHVEAAEKVQEESKLAKAKEIEKNDEKEESTEEALEAEQEPNKEKSRESSSSHTKSNSSSENGKSEGRNGSRQEEEKEDADKKKEEHLRPIL
ncbi:hypothetical protein GH714_014524 [Hevea brasiliensis]|uniref:Uncharacterized protein n=1 Tax=Hevea brasiliensis TaxID=3981 RepID=A0A6A6M615_HEVBR|nr:hypothetical protein GH714_014524 [Hevea brasiliensis]